MNREALALLSADDSSVDLIAPTTSSESDTLTPPFEPSTGRPAAHLEPGERLAQYQLIRPLGVGGMGIVYEAEDEWLQRRVALKILRADLPVEQIARERFLREARAIAAVENDHVVTIFNVGEAGGRPYMAMPLLTGETLATRLERETKLPPAEAARIGREIALGLAAAHAKGLVHRDVKPGNIWLEAGTGRVKLLDFGLALAHDTSNLTHSGFVIGTPAYMSPEQARSEPLDGRSDLFSLGVTLYLALTGDRPFGGTDVVTVMRNLEMHFPARVAVKRPEVPAAFSNLVMEMLAKDRKDRPPSAAIVADRLARPEYMRATHLPVAPPSVPDAPIVVAPNNTPWPTRSRPAVANTRFMVLLAIACIGIAGFWYFHLSNYGRLTIETDTADAEVQIRKDGQLKPTSPREREFDLRPGVYELVLVRPRDGHKLSRTLIEIRRNEQESVRVVRDVSMR